jgi:hypothetical protein
MDVCMAKIGFILGIYIQPYLLLFYVTLSIHGCIYDLINLCDAFAKPYSL